MQLTITKEHLKQALAADLDGEREKVCPLAQSALSICPDGEIFISEDNSVIGGIYFDNSARAKKIISLFD